jgi:hypothetical protein
MKKLGVFLVFILAITSSGCASVPPTQKPNDNLDPSIYLESEVVHLTEIDFNSGLTRILLTNKSEKPMSIYCEVSSINPDGDKDYLAHEELIVPLDPGKQDVLEVEFTLNSNIDVSDISSVTDDCSGEYTNKKTYPKTSDVSDCSFLSDTDKVAYWDVCFSTPEIQPSARANCRIVAFDSGNVPFMSRWIRGKVLQNQEVSEIRRVGHIVSRADIERVTSYSIKCLVLPPGAS